MKKADDILQGLLSNYNIEMGNTYSSFFSSWPRMAGQEAAAHSKVKDIEGHTLVIEVDHSAWIQILAMKKKSILFRIKKEYPDLAIGDMRIYLG